MSAYMGSTPSNGPDIFNTKSFQEIEIDVAGGSDVTISDSDAQHACLIFSGVLTANISVIVPSEDNGWFIENATTGAFTLTVKKTAGTGVAVTQGDRAYLRYSTFAADVVRWLAEYSP